MRIGSLFSGYGGLDLAVLSVLGGAVAWHVESDPDASRVLAHHWPTVPNLGDITRVDWSQVDPVDVLTGGFPCQDVSSAGKRAGLRPGTRSGLWSQMAYAVSVLRPRLVIAENVRGLLSASAASQVEPCPWCLGDDTDHAVRALGDPAFVEWMQGLADGHVTGVPDLSRNAMLRMLGNGVVPQQAAAALPWLLDVLDEPVCEVA